LRGEGRFCFQVQLKKCFGACGGTEAVYEYNSRLEAAIARYRLKVWPWNSAILVKEQDPTDPENYAFHLLNNWQHLCKVEDEKQLAELGYRAKQSNLQVEISNSLALSNAEYPADLDTYHILVRFLLDSNKLGINNLRIFPLEPISGT
jgi:DNA polymerase-3 subunit epsilon